MTESLPILIGSQALAFHGFTHKEPLPLDRDWDFIVNPELAHDIYEKWKKEEGKWWYYTLPDMIELKWKPNEPNVKIDLMLTEGKLKSSDHDDTHCKVYLEIFNICHEFQEDLKIQKLLETPVGPVLVPPLELLYALKKGHLHRMLKPDGNNIDNALNWEHHVQMYLWMRAKLGYKRMDAPIYDDQTQTIIPLKKSEHESLQDYYIRKIFLLNFDATTKAVGDTNISLEKTELEFFTDNVERFIDHDKLHSLFSSDPVFKKNQDKTNDSITMSPTLFFQTTPQEQVQCIRDEIMVLVSERKVIPHLIKIYRDTCKPYQGNALLPEDITETLAHFVTNLCGQGHAWLRRWCIDHYELICDPKSYDLEMIERICLQVVGITKQTDAQPVQSSLTTIEKFIVEACDTIENSYVYMDFFQQISLHSKKKEDIKSNVFFLIPGDSPDLSFTLEFQSVQLDYRGNLTIKYGKDNLLIQRLLRLWKECKVVYYDGAHKLIYDWKHNIGYYLKKLKGEKEEETREPILFKMLEVNFSDYKYNVVMEQMELGSQIKISTAEKRHCSRAYAYRYYSTDDSCGWRNTYDKRARYLNSYGNLQSKALDVLVTKIARNLMNLHCDEECPSESDNLEVMNNGKSFDEETDDLEV